MLLSDETYDDYMRDCFCMEERLQSRDAEDATASAEASIEGGVITQLLEHNVALLAGTGRDTRRDAARLRCYKDVR